MEGRKVTMEGDSCVLHPASSSPSYSCFILKQSSGPIEAHETPAQSTHNLREVDRASSHSVQAIPPLS